MRFSRNPGRRLRCQGIARRVRTWAVEPRVEPSSAHVALVVGGVELLLDPLEVGQLRADLKKAVVTASVEHVERFVPSWQASA